MFSFFKDKIKSALSSLTERFEKDAEPVEEKLSPELPRGQKEENKAKASPRKEDSVPGKKIFEEEKRSLLTQVTEHITKKKLSEAQFDTLFWDMEVELLQNNVAFQVIEKVKEDLRIRLVDAPVARGEVQAVIQESLWKSFLDVLPATVPDIMQQVRMKKEKPFVIVFIGTNGSGKTTSIAKLAYLLKKHTLSCVLAAGDTFRAGSQEQLEQYAHSLGIKVIKAAYGSDPAAVGYEARKFAQQKNIDVVLVDTAGRQHSNINLIEEMKKIVRVLAPDLKLYIGEMIAGNDCVDQVMDFDRAVGIDGIILSKADIDEKGGTALSLSYMTGKPIFFLGTGQALEDLALFDREQVLTAIFGRS